MNDEWITVNQITQLHKGEQIIFNEGKYGYKNGEISDFFLSRGNYLAYSLLLPILSLPALQLFLFLNEYFRLFILLLWSFLPVIIGISISLLYPNILKGIKKIVLIPFILVWSILFLFNGLVYYPFSALASDAPIEVAAAIFTGHILFALLAVIIYLTCHTIFTNRSYSLFGTIAIISCSSYLFWSASAKDHILVSFQYALIILFCTLYLKEHKKRYAYMGFFFIGILAWARPEIALPVFIIICVFYFIYIRAIPFSSRKCFAPVMTIIGAIPMFINNYIITSNFFLPPMYLYITSTKKYLANNLPLIQSNHTLPQSGEQNIHIVNQVTDIITPTINYYFSGFNTIIEDFFRVLIFPASGNMGLLSLCPLFIVGCISIFLKKGGKIYNKYIALYIIMIIPFFIAFISSLHNLSVSAGITPDIRYLSPLYIPLGLIGLIGLNLVISQYKTKDLLLYSMPVMIFSPFFLILFCVLFQPFNGGYEGFTHFFRILVLPVGLLLITSILLSQYRHNFRELNILLSSMLIVIPLSWQIIMIYLFSFFKFNGYNWWIPITEWIFWSFFIPAG
jgi:hypothetical protein